MNDKNIRKILIAYLQATNSEIRIYQEKSIGASICDVMAVTGELSGYEIKSDLDNYARLEAQVRAYNDFFDRCYLVVSDRHLASAPGRIPAHWGILCIREDGISLERPAKHNPKVSRRRQLSILWKLEMKNLLVKNGLPAYAQKDKGYIADQIAKRVDAETLGGQIASELLHRDYSVFDAEDYSVYSKNGVTSEEQDGTDPLSGQPEDFPAGEMVDLLSERDLTEYTLDQWIALYRRAKSIRERKETLYRQATVERIPHEIPYTDIEAAPGVPWIDPSIICEFVLHLLDIDKSNRYYYSAAKDCVKYEPVTGSWFIESKQYLGQGFTNAEVKYGLKRYNALFILEATLNLREIKLYDGNVYNERDTLAALEKQRLIVQEFKDWIWQDEDRRWQIEDSYNRLFAPYKIGSWDGSGLTFPDMDPAYELFPYQKDAVQRILQSKNTLLALDVGAGKTYIMIAAAMLMRRQGISRKNLFVVPNHIVGQWEKIFTDLYPCAKVLAIEPRDFRPQIRQKALKQIKEGDYDGIIMAYSCFEMIPLSETSVWENMQQKLRSIEEAIAERRRKYNWGSTPLSQEQNYIRKLTRDFLDSMIPTESGGITFDDLEINTLFLDEAHNYKNLPIRTKLKNLNGINTKGSEKCLDMLHKIRCVQNKNGGRGAVLATGTPLCNSISDAYAMQTYIQYEELERTHLDVFDNWVKTFAEPEQLFEIDVDTSRFRMIRKFAKFHNLPELSRMFSQVAVFHAVEDDASLPKLQGYTDTVIPRFPELTDYMQKLCERTEEIRSGKIDRKHDNMLKVSTDGRKAALSLKLVGLEQPDGEFSKLYRCVENVMALYQEHPHTTQLIFCDYSTPKGAEYSVYQELKDRLLQAGVPADQIAFIHHYQTESRKVELYERFNAGKVRILIGSTFKLGIGANVKVRLKAIHHLDVPWRPADMVQREGRMIRRGNENDDVLIYRYVAEGSFDSYSWQILETKQRFISQFLSGSSYQRTMSDLENNVLTYAEVKALALAEPLMKRLAEKENELKNLQILMAKDAETRKDLREEVGRLEQEIPKLNARYLLTLASLRQLPEPGDVLYQQEYGKLSGILTEEVVQKTAALPEGLSVLGFRIILPDVQDQDKPYIFLERSRERYIVHMGDSASGNARRILNFLKNFSKTVEKTMQDYRDAAARKQDLEAALREDSDYTAKAEACRAEIRELKESIQTRIRK